MSDESLWGDLTSIRIVKTPVSILREQGEVLTRATKGVLIAEVDSMEPMQQRLFGWVFQIRVPSLNDYVAVLLQVHHPATLYPIYYMNSPLVKLGAAATNSLTTEEQFKHALKEVLSSNEVKTLLSALISQART